jgi:hypothetical protein
LIYKLCRLVSKHIYTIETFGEFIILSINIKGEIFIHKRFELANFIGGWSPDKQTVESLLDAIEKLHGLTYSEKSCIKISVYPRDPAQSFADRVNTLRKKWDIRACDYNGDCIVRIRENGKTEWKIYPISELEK